MGNCLKTQLKQVVNNDKLNRLGEISIYTGANTLFGFITPSDIQITCELPVLTTTDDPNNGKKVIDYSASNKMQYTVRVNGYIDPIRFKVYPIYGLNTISISSLLEKLDITYIDCKSLELRSGDFGFYGEINNTVENISYLGITPSDELTISKIKPNLKYLLFNYGGIRITTAQCRDYLPNLK